MYKDLYIRQILNEDEFIHCVTYLFKRKKPNRQTKIYIQ